jgi:creatinine amidohydrolase
MSRPAGPARAVLWEEMRSAEFDRLDRGRTVVVLPTGAIEQHGPHLPVSADARIAAAIARRAATRVRDVTVLVAPAIWSGVSPFHTYRPGTLW